MFDRMPKLLKLDTDVTHSELYSNNDTNIGVHLRGRGRYKLIEKMGDYLGQYLANLQKLQNAIRKQCSSILQAKVAVLRSHFEGRIYTKKCVGF